MKTPVSSGVITNYSCNAECRHCMFASSPSCTKDYITPEMSKQVASLLKEAGALGVHIGGGEPFLDFDKLCYLIQALNRSSIYIDYIETNGYWAKDEALARRRLEILKRLGVSTIMVSVDPFHVEFVPLERPLRLVTLLDEYGFDYFIWQQKFLKRLMQLDITRTHSKDEISAVLGDDYITETAKEYGLGINGRALDFAKNLYKNESVEALLSDESCYSLTHPNHCHIDLYGNAVPSRCTGLSASARDYLETNIDRETYPVLSRLISGGTRELYEYALSLGFAPEGDGYPTKCALCFAMREYIERTHPSPDLAPKDYYENMRKAVSFK